MKKLFIFCLVSLVLIFTGLQQTTSTSAIHEIVIDPGGGGSGTGSGGDTNNPIINMTSSSISLEVGVDIYQLPICTVYDDTSNGLDCIVGGDTVDTTSLGVYVVTFDAVDDAGNNAVQKTQTVYVTNSRVPNELMKDFCQINFMGPLVDLHKEKCKNDNLLYQDFDYKDISLLSDGSYKIKVGEDIQTDTCLSLPNFYEKTGTIPKGEYRFETENYQISKRKDFTQGDYFYEFHRGWNIFSKKDDYHKVYKNYDKCSGFVVLQNEVELNDNIKGLYFEREYIETVSSYSCIESKDINGDYIPDPLCNRTIKQTFIPLEDYALQLIKEAQDYNSSHGVPSSLFLERYGTELISTVLGTAYSLAKNPALVSQLIAAPGLAAKLSLLQPATALSAIVASSMMITGLLNDYIEEHERNDIDLMLNGVYNEIKNSCVEHTTSEGIIYDITCDNDSPYVVFTEATWEQDNSQASISRESIRRYTISLYTYDSISFVFDENEQLSTFVFDIFWDTNPSSDTYYVKTKILATHDIHGNDITSDIISEALNKEYDIYGVVN